MLIELTITDFAIIDALSLRFGPHLNVFTGETGAGKSILVDAISTLVGERVASDVVRAGGERATVEGIFDIARLLAGSAGGEAPRRRTGAQTGAAEDGGGGGGNNGGGEAEEEAGMMLAHVLAQIGIEAEDGTLILTREIAAGGRGIARINRRAVPLSALQRVARFLVDIHGQSAHLELLRPEQHVYYLDRYAGTDELREQVAAVVGQWRTARRELERLRRDEREIARRVELLRFQVDEIAAARLVPAERDDLETERRRLMNAERLGELAAATYAALSGDADADTPGAADLIAHAQRDLGELLHLDDSLRDALATLEQALYLAQDASAVVRSYADEIAADPERLAEVEERLGLLANLRRKYGATLEEVLTYAEEAARELDELTHREERISALQDRDGELKAQIGALAAQLSLRRQAAADRLGTAMERELDDLNMRRARFQVQLVQRPDPDGAPARLTAEGGSKGVRNGKKSAAEAAPAVPAEPYAFTATGIDAVEFLIAPNPGEPLKPLARIASGGETSRLMLALKTILSTADIVPLLIFDEIDSGISGRSGQVVGEKLWQLGQTHQVLCVTHLPQIAALGDRHYRVAKASDEHRTTTQVEELAAAERVAELSSMLGGANTPAARANASELLARDEKWKRQATAAPRQTA
jgi:DNA repair protein RecN (Recombination protein N)